jgi:hypothetical protein
MLNHHRVSRKRAGARAHVIGDAWEMSQAETARRALEDACSGRELERVGEVYHPQLVDHVNPSEYYGLAGRNA